METETFKKYVFIELYSLLRTVVCVLRHSWSEDFFYIWFVDVPVSRWDLMYKV